MSILTPGGSCISLDGPSSLPVVIPHLIGFHPVRSLIVIGLDESPPLVRIACRVDIPDPEDTPWDWSSIVRALRRTSSVGAVVVVYPEVGESLRDLPHVDLVNSIATELSDSGFVVRDLLAIDGLRYKSYLCAQDGCCPQDGAEPSADYVLELSASLVFEGSAPHRSRDDVVAALRPQPPDDPMVQALANRRGGIEMRMPSGVLEKVTTLVDALSTDEPMAMSSRIRLMVLSAHVCADVHTRDVFLFQLTRRPDISVLARARNLFTDVARCFEGSERAAAAACLSVCAWVSGDGATARIAADVALETDPSCRLAALVSLELDQGQSPKLWAQLIDHLSLEQLLNAVDRGTSF